MRSPKVPVEEQYRRIMGCRKSGMSDHQWCLNHDINSGTFYNWIKCLRQNGCSNIPERTRFTAYESSRQEVVKIEMNSITSSVDHTDANADTPTTIMELTVGNMKLVIPNGTDLVLLAQTIKICGEVRHDIKSVRHLRISTFRKVF